MHSHTLAHHAPDNHLLRSLPPETLAPLLRHLTAVSLASGAMLHRPGEPIEHVYFPSSGMISLVATMENGASVEVGLVGSEGVTGSSVCFGARAHLAAGVVQIAGSAVRLRAEVLRTEFARGGPLQDRLLHYQQAFVTHLSQTAACNSLHTLEQRLSRWLLMSHDRVPCDTLPLTQEFLAQMLGVRRQGVVAVARALEQWGLIRSGRGRITLVDRAGLEATACECYALVRAETDRLLRL